MIANKYAELNSRLHAQLNAIHRVIFKQTQEQQGGEETDDFEALERGAVIYIFSQFPVAGRHA